MGEYLERRPGLISDKRSCVKRPRICWPVAEEASSISGFQLLLWAAGAAGDSGAPRPTLDSRASWEMGEGLVSSTPDHPPASRSSQVRWMTSGRKPSLDVKTFQPPRLWLLPPAQSATFSRLLLALRCSLWCFLLLRPHHWLRGHWPQLLSYGSRELLLWVGVGHRQAVVSG